MYQNIQQIILLWIMKIEIKTMLSFKKVNILKKYKDKKYFTYNFLIKTLFF
jgi:hypothetical protein